MRRILLALLALFTTIALGGWVSGGSKYSGITSMTFQDGVAPTAGYTGCADTYIRPGAASADTGKNYGASDSLKLSAPSATTSLENRILISFDISALPDSAIITQAQLWLYQIAPNSTVAANDSSAIAAYRIMDSWTEGTGTNGSPTAPPHATACWNRRKGQQGKAWNTAGAKAILNTHGGLTQWWPGTGMTFRDSAAVTTSMVGADTLWNAIGNSGFWTGLPDVVSSAGSRTLPKFGSTAARRLGWTIIDVTHQVDRWHIGANENNGFLLTLPAFSAQTTQFTYYSSNYSYKAARPKLVVYYFDPTSGSSGTGGRRVLGNGGSGIH
jgi:hypothetical protein